MTIKGTNEVGENTIKTRFLTEMFRNGILTDVLPVYCTAVLILHR